MDEARHNGIACPVEVYDLSIPPLKWLEIERARYWYTGLLDDGVNADSLMMLFVDDRSGASIEADADGDIRIRYDVDTGVVAGMEIDDFEYHFLKKHPELAAGWAALKPEGKDGFHNTPRLSDELALGYAGGFGIWLIRGRLRRAGRLRTWSRSRIGMGLSGGDGFRRGRVKFPALWYYRRDGLRI